MSKICKAEVKLLNYTPLNVALLAGLICTDSDNKIDSYVAKEFLAKLVDAGHESVLEHINYSFKIENVSRALLQELARHRHISLSVQSTRWALKKFADKAAHYDVFTVIDSIDISDERLKCLDKLNTKTNEINDLINEAVKLGIPNDILKYYLSESLTTKLVLTTNARELRLIFSLRTSHRALKEFQNLCYIIYNEIPEEHKFMFKQFFDN